jgi:uncharacterized protein (DUF58 family)
MKIPLHSNTRPVLIVIGVLLVLAVVDGYSGWRFLLFGLAAALGASRLWAEALARGLHFEREMRYGWAQVGDLLEERFTLANHSPAPALWLELKDCSTLPDYPGGQVTGIEGNSSAVWRSKVLCTRRGLFSLGPTILRTSDPLGLYTVELFDPRHVQIMITPPVVPLPHIEVAPGGRAGQGRPRAQLAERTVSAASVRKYVEGDSLRWIHWPTTARRNEPFVRTFESTPSGDWWVILDANTAVQAGTGARSTTEHGVILAASMADRGLRLNRAVGFISNGTPRSPQYAPIPEHNKHKEITWLPPRQGDYHRYEILRALAVLEPAHRSLAELLAGLETGLSGQSSLVIITPDIGGEWLEALLPLIWKGAIPTVLLLDAEAFQGAPAADTAAGAPGVLEIPGIPRVEQANGENETGMAPAGKAAILAALTARGIAHQIITPALLDRPEAQPGRSGRDEFRITPTGRAKRVNPAQDVSWRRL